MIDAPPRSLDQRRRALAYANGIKRLRVTERRLLQAHPELAVDILADTPPWMATLKVSAFLCWLPGVGPIKADKWLRNAWPMSGCKTLAGMTQRQRSDLITIVRDHYGLADS